MKLFDIITLVENKICTMECSHTSILDEEINSCRDVVSESNLHLRRSLPKSFKIQTGFSKHVESTVI